MLIVGCCGCDCVCCVGDQFGDYDWFVLDSGIGMLGGRFEILGSVIFGNVYDV